VQADAELNCLCAFLGALRLSPILDHRFVAIGDSKEFRVGSVPRVLHSGCVVPHNDLNWENFAPLRVRVFFWILCLGRTRTRAHLSRLGCVPSSHCPFCPGIQEDLPHLFVRCLRLAGLWAQAVGGMLLGSDTDVSSLLDGFVAHLSLMCPRPCTQSSRSCGLSGSRGTQWSSTV
jgi:hypothetical protein